MPTDQMLIPRVFHQIWLGDKPIPDHFKRWADRWLELNSGWTMEWWTDRRLPDIVNRAEYDSADKMAAKSDILRYEIIARHGGVYIDADMEPLKPLDTILYGVNAFYGDERPDTPCNAVIGCVPGDAFFGHLVARLPESWRGPGDIVDKTGPRFLKREIRAFFGEKARWDYEGRRWRITGEDGQHRLYGFDWRVFYPYYYTEPMRENDEFPDAYAKHHWTASWWKNGGV